jgi:hypothetical protein
VVSFLLTFPSKLCTLVPSSQQRKMKTGIMTKIISIPKIKRKEGQKFLLFSEHYDREEFLPLPHKEGVSLDITCTNYTRNVARLALKI